MTNKLDIFAKGRPYISPSQAGLLTGNSACPARWGFKYEREVKAPFVPLAMLRGTYFDWLCSGKGRWRPATKLDGLKVIEQRYIEYRPLLPTAFTPQVAIEIDLDYHDYWVRGFVDILPTDPSLPFIEIKLPATAWQRRKIAYNLSLIHI